MLLLLLLLVPLQQCPERLAVKVLQRLCWELQDWIKANGLQGLQAPHTGAMPARCQLTQTRISGLYKHSLVVLRHTCP
jgi:hypothetical protein